MPEAAVNEHGDLSAFPADVHAEALVGKRSKVDPIPYTFGMQQPANGHLAASVASLLTLHVPANDFR